MLLSALEILEQTIRARLQELENSTAANHAPEAKEKQDMEDALRVLTCSAANPAKLKVSL